MNKEIIINKSSVETLNIVGGKVNSVRYTEETFNTVRVYDDGKIGVEGCLGEADLDQMYQNACDKIKTQGIPYAYLPSKKLVKSIVRRKAYNPEKLLKAGRSLMAKLSKECPKFLIGGKMEYGVYSGSYSNSEGSELSYEGSELGIGLQLKDKESSNIMDAFYGASFPLYGKTAADAVVSDMKMLHDAYFTEKKPLTSGKYTVVTDLDLVSLFLKDLVAESYVAGGSVFSGKLGQRVFNENFSLYRDANPSTNYTAKFYDAEGTVMPSYRSPLFENGVVKNLLGNKDALNRYGLPQGGTSNSSYDGVPSTGLSAVYLKPSKTTLAELSENEPLIYISMSSGGDMTNDGVIGMPVMLAFLVEKGKITRRVSEFNLSGNIFEILGDDYVCVTADNLFKTAKSGMLVTKMNLLV